MDSNSSHFTSREAQEGAAREGRRSFLLLFPAAVFAGVAGVLAAAAYRFLRPLTASATANENVDSSWTTLAPLSEIKGGEPFMRKVAFEHTSGWTRVREERLVYVLPGENNRVVSAVCPHEGCEVAWRERERDFFCPCHDSSFAPGGERVSGPAQRGLARLPTRVAGGVLQVRYTSDALDDAGQNPSAVRG